MKKFLVKIACCFILLGILILITATTGINGSFSDKILSDKMEKTLEMAELNSPSVTYASVQPLLEIENVWHIEDTRTLSNDLVCRMDNGGAELGYDAESQTFYCMIGSGLSAWPELFLKAAGAEHLNIAWVDDYAWDDVRQAVEAGTSYQIIAWTEKEYQYVNVVFTGLPIVTIHVKDVKQLDEEQYRPARLTVSMKESAVDLPGEIHLRDGGFHVSLIKSYRIKFEKMNEKGAFKKEAVNLMDMGNSSEWMLLANSTDHTCVKNYLGFNIWKKWFPNNECVRMSESRFCEVFVQDEYAGIYQLMKPADEKEELEKQGANPDTDSVARLIRPQNASHRATRDYLDLCNFFLELRYSSEKDSEKALNLFDDFAKLDVQNKLLRLSDEEFSSLASRRVDIPQMMNFFLFLQAIGSSTDNAINNVFIYAVHQNGEVKYRFAPWDMDTTFRLADSDEDDCLNMDMPLPVRMLDLNVCGCRNLLWDIWQEKRDNLLTNDSIYEMIKTIENEINESGAFMRHSKRWRGEERTLDLDELYCFTVDHMVTIEQYLQEYWPLDN